MRSSEFVFCDPRRLVVHLELALDVSSKTELVHKIPCGRGTKFSPQSLGRTEVPFQADGHVRVDEHHHPGNLRVSFREEILLKKRKTMIYL